MRDILNCKVFENYENKEYRLEVKHKIFGVNTIKGNISGVVNDEEKFGVIMHEQLLFCDKKCKGFLFENKGNYAILSDDLMEISIFCSEKLCY